MSRNFKWSLDWLLHGELRLVLLRECVNSWAERYLNKWKDGQTGMLNALTLFLGKNLEHTIAREDENWVFQCINIISRKYEETFTFTNTITWKDEQIFHSLDHEGYPLHFFFVLVNALIIWPFVRPPKRNERGNFSQYNCVNSWHIIGLVNGLIEWIWEIKKT
mgnify:CR=1 FL=1